VSSGQQSAASGQQEGRATSIEQPASTHPFIQSSTHPASACSLRLAACGLRNESGGALAVVPARRLDVVTVPRWREPGVGCRVQAVAWVRGLPGVAASAATTREDGPG